MIRLLSRSLGRTGQEQLGEVLASKIDNFFAIVMSLSSREERVVTAGLGGHAESSGVLGLQGSESLGKRGLAGILTLNVLGFL